MTIKRFTVPERPADEAERQGALDAYCLAEPLDDPDLQALVAEAASTFAVPIALVSLIDRERQWFPARVGLPLPSTPRSISFCGHAINHSEPFVIPDASADERFAGNPLVINEGGIRFYAGAPLVTPEGHRIGTLCLIDQKPREPLSTEESARLKAFAAKAMEVLDRRRPA